MIVVLEGEIQFFSFIVLTAGDLYDRDCCSFDKFYTLDVFVHLLRLKKNLDSFQKLARRGSLALVGRGDCDVDV
jgi:hypothetical protein